MAEYRIIEEGAFADYEFEAQAETLELLFETCGKAAFNAMTDLSKVESVKNLEFKLEAENIEELLFAFLAELIYLKDVNSMLFNKFKLKIIDDSIVKCKAYGDKIDPAKHDLKTDVKAVTYHHLKVAKSDKGYSAHVILDL